MTHIITSLCLRDSGCVDVCPVECIVGGKPIEDYPWFYIDPDTCIDCGACIPECPYEAIFPEDEVPEALTMKDGHCSSGLPGTIHSTGQTSMQALSRKHKLVIMWVIVISPS